MPWRYSQQSLESFKGLAAGDTTQIDKLKELYEEGKFQWDRPESHCEVKENPEKSSSVLLLVFQCRI